MISIELEGRSKAPLNNVGLVVWQSAFVLADYLIAHPPFRTWRDVNVIELGSGTGQGLFRWVTSRSHSFIRLVASPPCEDCSQIMCCCDICRLPAQYHLRIHMLRTEAVRYIALE